MRMCTWHEQIAQHVSQNLCSCAYFWVHKQYWNCIQRDWISKINESLEGKDGRNNANTRVWKNVLKCAAEGRGTSAQDIFDGSSPSFRTPGWGSWLLHGYTITYHNLENVVSHMNKRVGVNNHFHVVWLRLFSHWMLFRISHCWISMALGWIVPMIYNWEKYLNNIIRKRIKMFASNEENKYKEPLSEKCERR